MKKTYFLILVVLMATSSLFSQTNKNERKALYPDTYTFEQADTFQKNGEYEKALWFYINLYPDNKTQVVEIIKALATKLDTVDLSLLIKTSFAMYGTFDPAITTFKNGTPHIDGVKLKQKGAWGDEIIQKISAPSKSGVTASDYFASGIKKMNAGNFKEALQDLNKANDIKPSGQIYYNRAFAKSEVKDFDGAIEDYNKAIELKHRVVEAYFERGFCKDQLHNPDSAIADYTKVIEMDPTYVDAYNNRAMTNLNRMKYQEAIKDFDKSIEIKPSYGIPYTNRGYAKMKIGDQNGACDDWTKAAELGIKQAKKFINDFCK